MAFSETVQSQFKLPVLQRSVTHVTQSDKQPVQTQTNIETNQPVENQTVEKTPIYAEATNDSFGKSEKITQTPPDKSEKLIAEVSQAGKQ